MSRVRTSIGILAITLFLVPLTTEAKTLAYRHKHFIYTIDDSKQAFWQAGEEQWLYEGVPIAPRPEWRVDGESIPTLPTGVTRSTKPGWSRSAIAKTILERMAPYFSETPQDVEITRDSEDNIVFSGVGSLGTEIDIEAAVDLTITALTTQGVADIILPVKEIQPKIIVKDKELRELGIQEIVAVGESDFSGSPSNRRHNIATGLSKFSGHLIKQGETFSFNKILGPVNGATGYLKELVILGAKTLPEYGGGLCQVSTTAYRGVWEHGFPIAQRRNHSYAVNYYGPQGTDATIYPPHTDMKFVNDSPNALLIQTYVKGDEAYFVYYGTKDDRETIVLGPYTWGHTAPPPDRIEYTTELAPGVRKKVGSRVPGLRSAWYRIIQKSGTGSSVETIYSNYQARPLYYQVGIAATPKPEPVEESPPSWISY